MQVLTEQQANKVIEKYLPIITEKFKELDSKVDVGIDSPATIGNMCYVYVSLPAKREVLYLDIFCIRYNIEYYIEDCL